MSTTTSQAPKVNPNVRLTGEKMKANAWFGKEDVRIVDAAVPTITDPGDAILRITGTTVCGSDLHLYHGEIPQLEPGDILGHEFCGIIDEVGPECKLKVGQRVVCSFQIACGKCEYCLKGLTSMCDTTNNNPTMNTMYGQRIAGLFGYSHITGGFPGGQAEYTRIPYADVNLLPIPDSVPFEKALYLSDIFPTSFHACFEADIQPGDVVGVWGAGPIGLLCTFWAKQMGARRVITIDNVPDRLLKAAQLGADTINFSDVTDVVDTIFKLEPKGLDKAIDAAAFRYAKSTTQKLQRSMGLETDTSDIVNEEIKAVKKFGTVVLIADYFGTTNGFNIGAVMEKGIRLIGGGQAPVQKYWKNILTKFVQTGRMDWIFGPLVTHRFPIEDIPLIYKYFDKKEKGIIKTFVETRWSEPRYERSPSLVRLTE
jgi:threonine dehydrogenase-like Zn-dependent dehydrogenase